MERENSEEKNGGVKLPIGFRFHPTDEELVVHYLKRKVFSLPLPATIIPQFEVFQFNPWDLPGDLKEKRYYFCRKKMNLMNKCKGNLNTGCGFWRDTNRDIQILAPASNLVIGMKKSHVFYQGKKKSRPLRTQWIMNEFCLVGSVTTPCLAQKMMMMQVGDWVVCRVYRKARDHHRGGTVSHRLGANGDRLGYSMAQTSSCSSSSECSSGITEISCNELDEEESSPRC